MFNRNFTKLREYFLYAKKTHSARLIRVKPVGVVAQAHIDSNTCGSHGSSEQQQYICLGDRSACWGCFVLFLVCIVDSMSALWGLFMLYVQQQYFLRAHSSMLCMY